VFTILLPSCIVEQSAYLTVDNRMPVDVTLTFYAIFQNGDHSAPEDLGTIPAGQTLRSRSIILGGIGAVPKVILKAEDPSGNVVWQKTWTGEEFVKLKDVEWKVVVSPETGS
jgi:hypothetical protein